MTARSESAAMPWVFWALGALFYFYGFFQRVAPSVIVDELMRDFAASAAILGNLSAFYFYAYASLQIPVGVMIDRWGPRRALSVAVVLCGTGSALFATADTLLIAYAGRALIGGGAGFAFVGTLKLVSVWFPPHRFALLSGLTLMLGMAGAVGGQGPLAALVAAAGWRQSMAAAAVFAMVLAAAIWLVVRDRPAAQAEPPESPPGGLLRGLMGVLGNRQSWFVSVFGGCMSGPMLAFGALWGVPYMAQAYGLERPAAAASVSLMMVGWGIGAPLSGWFSDRIGRRRAPMLLGAGGALASIGAVIYLPGLPLPAAQVLLLVNGIFSGAMILSFATAREHNAPEAAGAALGFANMASMAAGALFQPLIGGILDLRWDGRMADGARVYSVDAYQVAFLTLLACGVGAVVATLLSRETHCRPSARDC